MLKLICSTLLLAAALPAQQQLEILEGVCGTGNFQMNVTPKLQALVRNNVLEMAVDPAVLGGDPAPGQAKRLRVRFAWRAVRCRSSPRGTLNASNCRLRPLRRTRRGTGWRAGFPPPRSLRRRREVDSPSVTSGANPARRS